jgi:hypothetical protein
MVGPLARNFGTDAGAPLVTAAPRHPGGQMWATTGLASTRTPPSAQTAMAVAISMCSARQSQSQRRVLFGALGYDNYFMGAFVGGSFNPSTGRLQGARNS